MGAAGQDRADLDPGRTLGHDPGRAAGCDHMVLFDDQVAVVIVNVFAGNTSRDSVLEALNGLFAVHKCLDGHAGNRFSAFAAVHFADDQLLGDIDHSASQITGVRCTKSRVGQTLAGAVCRHEVLQNVQAFTEVGLDGQLDGTACGIRHQSAHTCQLLDLLVAASGTGVGHHEDIVVLIKASQQHLCQLVIDIRPGLDDRAVALFVRDQTAAEVFGNLIDGILRLLKEVLLLRGHCDIRDGDSHGSDRGILVAHGLDQVEDFRCLESAVSVDDSLQDLLQVFFLDQEVHLKFEEILRDRSVNEAQVLRQNFIEEKPAEGGGDHACDCLAVRVLSGHADIDFGVQGDVVVFVGQDRLVHVAEVFSFSGLTIALLGQVIDTKDHIL